ncbi:MAG: flavodoxin-dependent (E)-4-hydroxy-3-methylbut-2-enyl-diphosphate synthase [Candidatus Cloacimonetes bacterium]|nr:flavodoxin-dependent (E)-4-hydroxy-3-methylbut-2-enyl-diphosphate synthase [Candidatus Cloacimonadota bacterium]
MKRRPTKSISLGNMQIGSEHTVSIQGMCNTKTKDIESTFKQIKELVEAGCEIVRLAVPEMESAKVLKILTKEVKIPIIADIHFDYLLAIESIKNGVSGLRLNPGNIGSRDKIKKVIDYAKEYKTPIRIGVNSGSIAKHILQKHGVSAEGLVESAMEHVRILEDNNFDQIKISVKASSVPLTIEAYRLIAKQTEYPLHLGVTESGTEFSGTIKSSIGIGTLLAEGIGDTIRVSLTDDPVKEIKVGKAILKALGYRKGLEIISCPTCGRTEIPMLKLTKEVEERLKPFENVNMTVAVMGCEVNGPGEAKEADFGIAGGKNEGLIFEKGAIVQKVSVDNLVDCLMEKIILTINANSHLK